MNCQQCGTENRSSARFCRVCGQHLGVTPSALTSEKPGPQIITGDRNFQIGSVEGSQVSISLHEQASQPHSHPRPETPSPLPLPEQPPPQLSIPFKLQLIQRADLEFEVRALETPSGEPQATSRLPYTTDELTAVLKLLRRAQEFSSTQIESLKQLGLLQNEQVISDLHENIGQKLYQALMPQDINIAFQWALNQARPGKESVALQLRFDENAVKLAQYPWELLWHRRALLPSRAVELIRYISYPEAVTPLTVTPPLRLLYLQPRPADLPALPAESEQATVRQALNKLEIENILELVTPPQPTYEALRDYLETKIVHILHFDGHGVFARQCPKCQQMNYPHHVLCQAQNGDTICGQDITPIKPQGYLAFEHENGQTRWVRSESLGLLLYKSQVRLAVLSACRSGGVGGETLFGGIAPALIQAGIPAVVSTQLPINVEAAAQFMRGFYRALARFESIPAAVNAGRLHIFDTGEWFIPTLYLRSKDNTGYLFQTKR